MGSRYPKSKWIDEVKKIQGTGSKIYSFMSRWEFKKTSRMLAKDTNCLNCLQPGIPTFAQQNIEVLTSTWKGSILLIRTSKMFSQLPTLRSS